MQTNISNYSPFSDAAICAEQITTELIRILKKLLVSKVYLTYKTSYGESDNKHELNLEGQLEFIFGKPLDRNSVSSIRAASNIWNELELINRLTVLDAFSTLYHEALINYDPVEKTILFCQIFINDFVSIITSL